ncbi:putative thiazole-containing bacteriocin maturation protein [Priestia taiwanensis]|uniref:Thiazole-containing bacteriocin maturation protein n=1 Tax=Priestia taiwanensis TaxID=1347902 RepID=A0A917AQ25_9BACI|nr:putative thiazole-containing bacteriocin maturation protein [Priestia taiwanensis]MBM7362435.1 putative thiazole-containing bacteriocin maturation protein [Priestia taiwanensis]GGE62212.1 putative thiazole-containing bacteriocin maturation protein [Priestia taiwanensis]
MEKVHEMMRPKIKRDTFFYYDNKKGVYFRNNVNSFWMEGNTVAQWIEKLWPMLNGEHSLHELTNSLPEEYRRRVYDIVGALAKNDFVRDVSSDRSHDLRQDIIHRYASQVEFLDSIGNSGAARFESYRQTKVLAIGSGSFLLSLVSSLLESGLAKFHVFVTDSSATNRKRLEEVVVHHRKSDQEVSVGEMKGDTFIPGIIGSYDAILYVSPNGNREELQFFHTLCKQEGKLFVPAICLDGVGLAGPIVHPDYEGCWETAWRSLHKQLFTTKKEECAPTVESILANIITFELVKKRSGLAEATQENKVYIMNLETLEGQWHSFIGHPSPINVESIRYVEDILTHIEKDTRTCSSTELFQTATSITSEETGIFHKWEERELSQVPLAQFCVQAVNPSSDGPAELLREIICVGLTHEEAQREATLCGLESYMKSVYPSVHVGVGTSSIEGISRALQQCLTNELQKKEREMKFARVQLEPIEDKRCEFYLQALNTMKQEYTIGIGENICGFPVMCLQTNNNSYCSVALNQTLALRNVLQCALRDLQNKVKSSSFFSIQLLEEKPSPYISIPVYEETEQRETLQYALNVLQKEKKNPLVYELPLHSSFQHDVVIYGVTLREEE